MRGSDRIKWRKLRKKIGGRKMIIKPDWKVRRIRREMV
jgi:hypothetical protein